MKGRGLFLVFEGVEGAGKTTQVRLLAEWLSARGIAHEQVREPGGTRLGEEIRRLLLLGADDVPPRTELLLMLAARAALIEHRIAPALDEGRVVVADRFELSTLAYQGAGRQLGVDDVQRLNAFATRGLRPDLTVYLEVPVSLGRERCAGEWDAGDRIERAGREFHERVAEAYRLLASHAGIERVVATAPAAQVHEAVLTLLRSRFPETFASETG